MKLLSFIIISIFFYVLPLVAQTNTATLAGKTIWFDEGQTKSSTSTVQTVVEGFALPLPLHVLRYGQWYNTSAFNPKRETIASYPPSATWVVATDSSEIKSDWYIDGKIDARIKHKGTSSLIVGILSGCATAPYIYTGVKGKSNYFLGATLFSLPTIGTLASSGIRIDESDFDAKWAGNPHYLDGYRAGAKKKAKTNTLIGYGMGFVAGLGISFLVDKVTE